MKNNTAVREPSAGEFGLVAEVIGPNPASTGSKCFSGLNAVAIQKA